MKGDEFMIRYAWDNVKNSVKSRYFLLGILLMTGVFFCNRGFGFLSHQAMEVPLIIEEIFKYPMWKYEEDIMTYNVGTMFTYGMGGLIYLVMPLAGIGYLLRFCDERYGGYDRMILARIGKKNYFAGTLLTSAILGILTVMVSGTLILGLLYARLPSGAGIEGVPQLSDCVKQLGFACVLAVIGNWLGFLIAVLTESRFLAMALPVLLFEIWTEMCMFVPIGHPMAKLNLKWLFNPIQNTTPILMYLAFVIISLTLFGAGFYFTAIKKMERGR